MFHDEEVAVAYRSKAESNEGALAGGVFYRWVLGDPQSIGKVGSRAMNDRTHARLRF